jgi:dihydroflavonol-4-reductase
LSPSKTDAAALDERQGFNPDGSTSDYAYSKNLAEMEIARGVVEGLPAAMVNPSIILLPGASDESSASLFSYARKGMPFYPGGWINYVDGRDVARVVVCLLSSGPVDGRRMVLNAGHLTYQSFLSQAAEVFGAKAPYIEASPWMAALGWRLDALVSFLFGKKPFLTRYTASASARKLTYKSLEFPDFWPDFRFISFQDTLKWIHSARN